MTTTPWDDFLSLVAPDLPTCPWLTIKEALARSASEFCQRSKVWRVVSPPIQTIPGVCDYVPELPGMMEHVWDVSIIGRYQPLEATQSSLIRGHHKGQPMKVSGITAISNGDGTVTATAVYVSNPDVISQSVVFINGDTSNQYNGAWPVVSVVGKNVTWRMLGTTTPTAATGEITATNAANMGAPVHFAQVDDSIIRLYPIPDSVQTFTVNCAIKPPRNNPLGVESFIYETYSEVIASGAIYRLAIVPGKTWSNPDIAAYHKANFERGVDAALYKDMQSVAPRARPRMF